MKNSKLFTVTALAASLVLNSIPRKSEAVIGIGAPSVPVVARVALIAAGAAVGVAVFSWIDSCERNWQEYGSEALSPDAVAGLQLVAAGLR